MSDRTDAYSLVAEIRKSRLVLGRIACCYDDHYRGTMGPPESTESAIVLAEVFGNFYTCVETIFLRISQYFENNLAPQEWHKELLRKMALEIPEVRRRVASDETFGSIHKRVDGSIAGSEGGMN